MKTKRLQIKLSGAVAALMISGCLFSPQAPDETQCDLQGFIHLWEEYESSYPQFARKGIDWVEVAREYYPRAADAAGEEELLSLIHEMLILLEDESVYIFSVYGDTIYSKPFEIIQNVDMDVLLENYLPFAGYVDETDGFGWCDPAVLPYVYFKSFPRAGTEAASKYDQFIKNCNELGLPAIILDIRMNPTGLPGQFYNYDQFVMSRLVTRSRISAVYRTRSGPYYDQYHDWRPPVRPGGSRQYTGTVYLLTGRGCTHAAEDMAVNMSRFSNIVLVGDTTAGMMNGTHLVQITEDWYATVGHSTVLSHEYEWIDGEGLPPDVYVEATEAHFAAGIDPVFEHAAELVGFQPRLQGY